MKALAATLISLSLSAWVASHAHTGAAQVDASPTVLSARLALDQHREEWFATADQRARRALHWLGTG